jgi:hypothetical protein
LIYPSFCGSTYFIISNDLGRSDRPVKNGVLMTSDVQEKRISTTTVGAVSIPRGMIITYGVPFQSPKDGTFDLASSTVTTPLTGRFL